MTLLATADRHHWHAVLATGGRTEVPRWTLDPRPGTAVHRQDLPAEVTASLRRLAGSLAVPTGALLLAAHAKVLAALTGESEVWVGRRTEGTALPCRISTGARSWQDLVLAAHRAETDLVRHAGFPVAELCAELGLPRLPFETVVDPTGEGELDEQVVLQVAAPAGFTAGLSLQHRTDALDAGAADRIAGYHLRALALMAADPAAEHARQSLLSAEELRFQREELVGRPRPLPDRRLHELVEDQVAAHPDTVAATRGDRSWTYAELDARANRLSRALLARGLGHDRVVAVVSERTLDWLAAVLAVLKAGGVYLPVEPHFPAARVTAMLSRAGCRLVLAETGSTASLDEALDGLPGVTKISLEEAYAEQRDGSSLRVRVTADQPAYLYFTSGSTGEPKGALCEHRGMLNHVLAKIDDLEVLPGEVVAQTAPQCFDISLWQLLAALVVGGRTLLVEQEVVLDVERFVDTVADGRVAVLQVVPSYLEVVLTYLEQHPRPLPDLHHVSVTGEAVKKELVQRWFAVRPGVRLVNAYGLTETSDDTNHEVMDAPPAGDRVPLGRPLPNVDVQVVDDQLVPVPLGAPGAIVFSGICLARGYVNDPERTREAFVADPHRAGQRLYRCGDYGRWRPDGKLEFLGRRDHQVKVAGFRIEIGDIENALLQLPGVRDGAVVVAGRPGRPRRLVACYAGPRPLPDALLADRLGRVLPPYMVPAAYRWLPRLPLTANSKIDRTALTRLAEADEPAAAGADDQQAPRTPTERRVAAAWASTLGLPAEEIGRSDHFFHRGGTSLSAVKLAIALDRAVSLRDLTRHPVLADLAELLDRRGSAGTDHQAPTP